MAQSQMTETKSRALTHFVDGRHIAGASGRFSYVFDPSSVGHGSEEGASFVIPTMH